MNESQKNIETCLPEDILAEVAGVPQDAHFRSLLEEAFDPLQQSALAQAGWDDYQEVVLSHKPYTFTSSVRQMKSNLLLLFRRLWRFPFGTGTLPSLADAGTIRSLSDMWSHYIDRLQGSETYGIPSRLDQLTDLPSAPALLSDRTISGVPEAADGISLVNLACSSVANDITELDDPNKGWIYSKANMIGTLCNVFPNVGKITLHCKQMTASIATSFSSSRRLELHIYDCTSLPTADTSFFDCYITDATQLYLYVHDLVEFYAPATNYTWCSAREVYLPSFAKGRWKIGFHRSYGLEPTRKVYFGCKGRRNDQIALYSTTVNLTNLEDIEFVEGARQPFMIKLTEPGDASSIRATGMTRETIMDHIINRLADNRFEDDGVTPAPAITISLGSLEIAKLTAEDIAVATNKNYTLA